MLQVEDLSKNFGGLAAVSSVDMEVQEGELVGIIGPNGAGKTTLFNLLTGYIRPTSGRVWLYGKEITGKRPHQIAARGMVRTFQQNNVFSELTVAENVRLACHLTCQIRPWEAILHTPSAKHKEQRVNSRVGEILELLGISHLARVPAAALPHGHKRILGIAVALACEPRLLLLDEPLAGMNTTEVDMAVGLIRKLWESGLTILLIEHNMRAVMGLCQRFVVLNFGKKLAEGTPEEIRNNPEVVRAYLGTAAHAA
ncbi:MAG: ABC transporter ATP-binding protein [Thermoleophilia bacterium]|nr:ABC transporter ATP-binding protein [Thermoleophilia bacterium]